MIIPKSALTARNLLYFAVAVCAISLTISLYYAMTFWQMVDRRLDGDVFKHSARIYAADNPDVEEEQTPFMTSFFDASRTKRRLVEFDQIPKVLLRAVLYGEDRDFYTHYGLSPKRIAGAFVSNVKGGAGAQGGSTITQQLARNLFLTREPTLRRKLSEAFIALILEQRLTKQQIFTMYANEVYLGHRDSFAIHGFAEGAKAFFGKDLKDLTLSEAATMAGIIPAPNAYSPVQHRDRAKARRNLILRIMFDAGEINNEQYEEARQSELKIAASLDPAEGHYLVDYIRSELLRDFSEETLMTGGLSVQTTVDLALQKAAMDSVAYGLRVVNEQLSRRAGKSAKDPTAPTPQAGLIALDPRTGEIKAMVGGAHYGASQYNRITHALRQPGSIFKPFVYAAAMETALQGIDVFDFDPNDDVAAGPISALTTLVDEPTVFYAGKEDYTPKNYGGGYHGEVTLRTAFQHSLNIPTVMLAERIGYNRVVQLARRMGFNPRIRAYPSVALGAFEVTPIEIAGAYTAFANGGRRMEPHAIRKVLNDNKVLKTYDPEPEDVLSPQVAYLMTHLMEGVINYGTGAGVRSRGFMLPAAGKTGTSRDGWFAGYTKELLVITWVGFDDGRDLNIEGSRSALPIWADFMKKAYKIHPARNPDRLYFRPPPGIELVRVDAETLLRGDPYCGDSFYAAFIEGTAPTTSCLDADLQRDLRISAHR